MRTFVAEAPWGRIEQCRNGHLLCNQVGPEAVLNDLGTSTFDLEFPALELQGKLSSCASQVRRLCGSKCPVCRVRLSDPHSTIRALVAEQTIAALPSQCRHCQGSMRRDSLRVHEAECPRAPVLCVAAEEGGCKWKGRREEQDAHEATCVYGVAKASRECAHPQMLTHTNIKPSVSFLP